MKQGKKNGKPGRCREWFKRAKMDELAKDK